MYKNNFVNAMYSNILTNEDSKTFYQVDIATDTYKLVLGGSKQVGFFHIYFLRFVDQELLCLIGLRS